MMKMYLIKIWDKMKIFYSLSKEFVSGIIAFIKPLFESKQVDNDVFSAVHRRVIRNSDGVIIGYSDSPLKANKSSPRTTPKKQQKFNYAEDDGHKQMNKRNKKKAIT